MKRTILIAVYGTLRRGFGNHKYLLSDAEYKGTFKTEPEYSLYTLGGFPGLKENGKTAVTMEVYAVSDTEARSVDSLEGYTPGSKNNTFYDKKTIETPWGPAGTYLYVRQPAESLLIESGDWTEFQQLKTRVKVTEAD